jgi:RNA polymerase sigma-70 factor, ECF subfamily
VTNDSELVERIRAGCERSLEAILDEHGPFIRNVAGRVLRNHQDIQEVAQDVYLAIWRKSHQFEGRSTFKSWLYRVVQNYAVMKLRKRNRRFCHYLADIMPDYKNTHMLQTGLTYNPAHILFRKRIARHISESAKRIGDGCEQRVFMHHGQGKYSNEVATATNRTLPAVKSSNHRDLMHLREAMRERLNLKSRKQLQEILDVSDETQG